MNMIVSVHGDNTVEILEFTEVTKKQYTVIIFSSFGMLVICMLIEVFRG